MEQIIKINGVEVATPCEISITFNPISANANRNSNAKMIMDRIAVKQNLKIKFNKITAEEEHNILKLLLDNTFVDITYFDIYSNNTVTKKFYSGNITVKPIKIYNNWAYKDTEFTLVEQ